MKKTVIFASVLGAFTGVAHAQSTVTLYGIIDEGLTYTSNIKGENRIGLDSGILQGSRFGLKGSEDLGGGLKAIFQLENGFNTSTGTLGQGGRMFGRQAYVGLSSASVGSATLGRQYDSVVDYLGPITANGTWAGELFSHPYDNDNTDNSFRINNSVKYTSANYGGFQFGGLYGFSNAAGEFANNRAWSVGTRYAYGSLTVAAAYLDLNNPNSSNTSGAQTDGANSIAGLMGETFSKQRTGGLGASYAFGSATASVMTTQSFMSTPVAYARFLNVEANLNYFVTSALSLGAMYDYTNLTISKNGAPSRPHFHTIGLMSDYFLSKRTDVYAQTVFQNGSAGSEGLVGVVGAGGFSSSDNQFVARVGIRHKF